MSASASLVALLLGTLTASPGWEPVLREAAALERRLVVELDRARDERVARGGLLGMGFPLLWQPRPIPPGRLADLRFSEAFGFRTRRHGVLWVEVQAGPEGVEVSRCHSATDYPLASVDSAALALRGVASTTLAALQGEECALAPLPSDALLHRLAAGDPVDFAERVVARARQERELPWLCAAIAGSELLGWEPAEMRLSHRSAASRRRVADVSIDVEGRGLTAVVVHDGTDDTETRRALLQSHLGLAAGLVEGYEQDYRMRHPDTLVREILLVGRVWFEDRYGAGVADVELVAAGELVELASLDVVFAPQVFADAQRRRGTYGALARSAFREVLAAVGEARYPAMPRRPGLDERLEEIACRMAPRGAHWLEAELRFATFRLETPYGPYDVHMAFETVDGEAQAGESWSVITPWASE